MDTASATVDHQALDSKTLAEFVHALNISRRHLIAYPKGHPVMVTSGQKVLDSLARLLQNTPLVTLGVARDTLLLDTTPLDQGNSVYRDLATALFRQGIAAITFRRDLTLEELHQFSDLLNARREELQTKGGLEKALVEAGVTRILAHCIDYSVFRATEEQILDICRQAALQAGGTPLWERFVHGLIAGSLDPFGEELSEAQEIDPGLLAEILNWRYARTGTETVPIFGQTLAAFLRQIEVEGLRGESRTSAFGLMRSFVEHLRPELRQQFLASSFSAPGRYHEAAEELFSSLSAEIILEVLDDINRQQTSVPQTLVDILNKLDRHAQDPAGPQASGLTPEDAGERLRTLFKEEQSARFSPEAYRDMLNVAITSDQLDIEGLEEINTLKTTMENHRVEKQIHAILLEMARHDPPPEVVESLKNNFIELAQYFLQIGDFNALRTSLLQLRPDAPTEGGIPPKLRKEFLTIYRQPTFLEEVVNAPAIWGKTKYQDIETLMRIIGPSVIDPLLNRLGQEENISLRRYYMDCLQKFGERARRPILERLRDSRWYLVRNLIMLLKAFPDDEVKAALRKMVGHPHSRVRQEAWRVLLNAQDTEANRMLSREFDSENLPRLLAAISNAEQSRDAEVQHKLFNLLEEKSLSPSQVQIKTAVIQCLAERGEPSSIPALERFLSGTRFLHPLRHRRLKTEIVRSLGHYPEESVEVLLQKLRIRGGKLGILAEQVAKSRQEAAS